MWLALKSPNKEGPGVHSVWITGARRKGWMDGVLVELNCCSSIDPDRNSQAVEISFSFEWNRFIFPSIFSILFRPPRWSGIKLISTPWSYQDLKKNVFSLSTFRYIYIIGKFKNTSVVEESGASNLNQIPPLWCMYCPKGGYCGMGGQWRGRIFNCGSRAEI